ncbi:hypothetical protein Scep_030982 [Stephania cephalantha]|uniref:Uncharacterized protein n=1 Tax=Stephania cephalantha TaxID=152367 RepID=A0AAP0DXT1_9MAGN
MRALPTPTRGDVLAGVEARLTRLELAVADGKDQFEDANASIEDLEGKIEDLKGKMLGALNEVVATQRQERDEFQTRVLEVLESMKVQVEEMRGDWAVWKRAMANGAAPMRETPRVKTPDPKAYSGSRDAREIDNFLFVAMNRTSSKHSAVDGQTLPERRPQTKDGQAPVPRVRVFPIMSLLRSELN